MSPTGPQGVKEVLDGPEECPLTGGPRLGLYSTMPYSARKRSVKMRGSSLPLSSRDFERHLRAKAAEVAPADVGALVARADEIRARIGAEHAKHPTLAHHARLALELLSDHARGACPQIPYHTVSVLTAALHYYLEPFDVIPDFIPRFGKADDSHVLDLAWKLDRAGIERYVAWKGLAASEPPSPPGNVVPPPKLPRGAVPGSQRTRTRVSVRRKGSKRR